MTVGFFIGGLFGLFYGGLTLFGLFNAESSPFGLFWFYGISTIVGYFMPNPFLYSLAQVHSLNVKTVLFQTI